MQGAHTCRAGQDDGYDALFVSPHKFVGGPGSAGVLVLDQKLYTLASAPPSTSGGGTVAYVNGISEEVRGLEFQVHALGVEPETLVSVYVERCRFFGGPVMKTVFCTGVDSVIALKVCKPVFTLFVCFLSSGDPVHWRHDGTRSREYSCHPLKNAGCALL